MMKFSAPSREEIIAGLVTDEEIGFDDEIHRGHWENDLPQGAGIRNYPNGQVYVGNFQAGQRQGHGELRRLLDSRNNDLTEGEGVSTITPQRGGSVFLTSTDHIVRALLLEWDKENPLLHRGLWNNNDLVS
jgi:hypothetical protein